MDIVSPIMIKNQKKNYLKPGSSLSGKIKYILADYSIDMTDNDAVNLALSAVNETESVEFPRNMNIQPVGRFMMLTTF